MTSKNLSFPMRKADPLRALPWPPIPQETLELARKQHVASCCSDPYWIRIARAVPEGEVEFWKSCSLTTIHPSLKACGGFSPEELMAMSIPEIVAAVQARSQQVTNKV